MSLVSSPSAAMWRSWMPVRSVIHASDVSTIFSRSALVTHARGRVVAGPQDLRGRTVTLGVRRGRKRRSPDCGGSEARVDIPVALEIPTADV